MNRGVGIVLVVMASVSLYAQDTVLNTKRVPELKGQLSAWGHYNTKNSFPLYVGVRYIPQINYEIGLKDSRKIDFEASTNMVGNIGVQFFDSLSSEANFDPYRLWGRYSTDQFELRMGLQKIDFGTAVMLRALRWFDQVDPRDPLQLTEGVYGVLSRYYLLDNTNIWLWGLWGNTNLKGMELLNTNSKIPEFGGRIQSGIPLGEAALSYHFRMADSRGNGILMSEYSEITENRIAVDAKWDLIVGLWFEGAWVTKNKDLGIYTNKEVFTLGTDYTFGIGSGLNLRVEHMLLSYDQQALGFSNTYNTSGFSVAYPIGMFDNINAIIYYDWNSSSVYNFVNWYKSYDHTSFYLMAYWNPKDAQISTGGAESLYGGKGVQLMFVYNH